MVCINSSLQEQRKLGSSLASSPQQTGSVGADSQPLVFSKQTILWDARLQVMRYDNMSSVNLMSSVKATLTPPQRSKLQEVLYFWSMTGLPPLFSSVPPLPRLCLTGCLLPTAAPSLSPHGLCRMTGCCRPTVERDMGKFTNSAPACPGRQKLGILIERCIL